MAQGESGPSAEEEGAEIVRRKGEEVASLPWRDLDAYGEHFEFVEAPIGRHFVVKSQAFWEMEPWESELYVMTQAHLIDERRRRTFLRRQRYWRTHYDWRVRGGVPDDPIPERPADR